MGALFDYMQDVQRRLRDSKQDLLDPEDIVVNINRARREVAMRSQAIRRLTPISAKVVSCLVTNGGSGYSNNPTCTITGPDFPSGLPPFPNGAQATASAIVQGGVITAIDITYGGDGYFQPQITITDSTGTGATGELTISSINVLQQGQERYSVRDIDLSEFPGVKSIHSVRGVSIIYSNYRYSLPCYSFSTYQASIRQFPFQYSWVPTFCSQFGQGDDTTFYFYPLPSQTYQMEWDCTCLPQDLIDDDSVEAIPAPWTDAVMYFAAHLCYLDIQNGNFAEYYKKQFDEFMHRYRHAATPGRIINPYGRY